MKNDINRELLRALRVIQSSLPEPPVCLIFVSRKAGDDDAVVIIAPGNRQDAMRINTALRQAQNALFEVTKRAIEDGQKQAEKLK